MRYLATLGALCFLAATSVGSAQITVSAQTARTNFLLYERVDLAVTVTNTGAADLVLDNDAGHPWLSFLVSHHNRLPVRPERKAEFKAVALKSGESKTLRINLTPLFSFREEGDYTAEAVVDLPGEGQIISDPIPFSVMHGQVVWSETHPVDGSQHIFSLIRFAPSANSMKLYLRVESPDDNRVYANLALGDLVAYIDPQVFFDPQGNLHVMQPIAASTYLYSRVDGNGKVEHQGVFTTFQTIPPRLTKIADGNVVVQGGLEENPNQPRESLSHGQQSAKGDAPAIDASPSSPPDQVPAPVDNTASPMALPAQNSSAPPANSGP